MQKHIQALMQKEMTRREFLTTVGFGLATVVGLSSLLKLLGKDNPWHTQKADYTYGGGTYGGKKAS